MTVTKENERNKSTMDVSDEALQREGHRGMQWTPYSRMTMLACTDGLQSSSRLET